MALQLSASTVGIWETRHGLVTPAPGQLTGTWRVRGREVGFSGRQRSPTRVARSRKSKVVWVSASVAERTAVTPSKTTTPGFLTWRVSISAVKPKRPNPVGEMLLALEDSVLKRRIEVAFISEDVDPATGTGRRSVARPVTNFWEKTFVGGKVEYNADVTVDEDFGVPGAISLLNKHSSEFFVASVSLTPRSPLAKPIYFSAQSHIHSTKDCPDSRIIFSNKPCLPQDTPAGLVAEREEELSVLRGDGTGERKYWERVYDYDTYNDLGNVDFDAQLKRPVLGNEHLPYPRRMRTGRRPSKGDPSQESQTIGITRNYVPRDEKFEEVKGFEFVANALRGVFLAIIPAVQTALTDTPTEFDRLDDVDNLYISDDSVPKTLLNRIAKWTGYWTKYPTPQLLVGDKLRWTRDDEFGRQILAGMNPVVVQRLKTFPHKSSLDEAEYGPRTSTITAEHLEKNLQGLTVEQALEQNRLYFVDYHDDVLPFVNTFSSMGDGRKVYAPLVILFYTLEGAFKPVAIELSLPPPEAGGKGVKRVFTPGTEATSSWLWLFAKIHFSTIDLALHELYSHWVRSHAVTEPYIIATNRHLSTMHPVYKLLRPHFRYTIEMNSIGRKTLIASGGIIERCVFTGKYSMEIGALLYGKKWRFDLENLPADLVARGMAEWDPLAPQGVKLLLEDYPFGADALLLWGAIKEFVQEYVFLYYPDSAKVRSDFELQAWWEEIRMVGHADKAHEPWWPELNTEDDLVNVLSTIIWVCSAHHASVNFGQYTYGGFMPNRPCNARRYIPQVGEPEWEEFLAHPDKFLLSMLPDQPESTVQMLVTAALATHAGDEEYLGFRREHWTGDEKAIKVGNKFAQALQTIQEVFERRNQNPKNKLRFGAGVIPYTLLYPKSNAGCTGKGIPNSISV